MPQPIRLEQRELSRVLAELLGDRRWAPGTSHQNHRPSYAAMDGVMNDRTISMSNSTPRAIVVPI